MGLKPRFNLADIERKLKSDIKKIDAAFFVRLQYLGNECVKIARELDTYKDQTGNLRNSIGYIIAKDGKILTSDFTLSSALEGPDGNAQGEKVAKSVLAEYPQGHVLIVVAGMNYAEAVETRNLDVLTSAELYAKHMVPVMRAKLMRQVAAMK